MTFTTPARSAPQITHARGEGYLLTAASLIVLLICFLSESKALVLPAFVVAVLGLLRAQWQAFLIILYPIYGLGGALLSNFLIENGAYITEQFRYGSFIGSTSALGIFSVCFLTAAHIGIVTFTKRYFGSLRLSSSEALVRRFLLLLLLGCTATYALLIGIHGIAWNLEGAKFEYWATIPSWLADPAKLVHYYVAPATLAMFGFYLSNCKPSRKRIAQISGFILVLLFALYFVGEKFSSFVSFACFLAIGIGLGAIGAGVRGNITRRLVLVAAVLSGVTIYTLTRGYEALGSVNVFRSIADRALLQGHVWFGIFEKSSPFHGFIDVTELLRANTLDTPSGLDRLGYEISSSAFINQRMELGVGFTMGGPAAPIAAFGLLGGLLVYVISAFSIGLISRFALYSLSRKRLTAATIAFASFFIFIQITQMGNWQFWRHEIALLFYLTIIVVPLLASLSKNRPVPGVAAPSLRI